MKVLVSKEERRIFWALGLLAAVWFLRDDITAFFDAAYVSYGATVEAHR
jgi:hypothetical protein